MQAWQECSIRLIEEKELDPVYNVLVHGRNELGDDWAYRFCVAHLMFYNVETSFTLADLGDDHFWFRVLRKYDTIKRGQERRHYRGQAGLTSIDSLRIKGTCRDIFTLPVDRDLREMFRKIGLMYLGFGEYFKLKWADFADVLGRLNMDYKYLPRVLFDGSAKGLQSIWPGRHNTESLAEIVAFIKQFPDPFQGYRPCGLSEAETIACAYRTYYVKTTYKFGWDINNLRSVLSKHPSPNAKCLLAGVPDQTKEWK